MCIRDRNETIEAEGNLQDVVELLANLRKNKEPLLHCSVFIELKAKGMDALKELQSEIAMELTRSKITVDRLTLRQKEGYLSVLPVGANQFGAQFERVLPASSVANLYPFNFSGKTDPRGIYLGCLLYTSYKPIYAESGLEGAEFEIRAAEDITTPDGTLRYSAGEVVDTLTTSADGTATSTELYLGKYEIVETKAPYGMVLNLSLIHI